MVYKNTSINITEEQYKYLQVHAINLSKFVRKIIQGMIDQRKLKEGAFK